MVIFNLLSYSRRVYPSSRDTKEYASAFRGYRYRDYDCYRSQGEHASKIIRYYNFIWNVFLKLFTLVLIRIFFYNLVNMLAIVEDVIEVILNILVEAHTEIPLKVMVRVLFYLINNCYLIEFYREM